MSQQKFTEEDHLKNKVLGSQKDIIFENSPFFRTIERKINLLIRTELNTSLNHLFLEAKTGLYIVVTTDGRRVEVEAAGQDFQIVSHTGPGKYITRFNQSIPTNTAKVVSLEEETKTPEAHKQVGEQGILFAFLRKYIKTIKGFLMR